MCLLSSVANLQTMKNTLLPFKSLFLAVSLFSLFAFLAVNVHARCNDTVQTESLPVKVEAPQEQRELALPTLTVVERILEIAGSFLPVSH